MKRVVASNNPGKLREFGQLLAPLGWETVAQKELGVPEPTSRTCTFVENALGRRHAARAAPACRPGRRLLGLCVHAPAARPASFARYAGEPKSDSATTRS